MGIPNLSTSTLYRPSCRGTQCSFLKAAKRGLPWKKPDLEPRQHNISKLSPPEGSTTGRAIVIGPYLRARGGRGSPDGAKRNPGTADPGLRGVHHRAGPPGPAFGRPDGRRQPDPAAPSG